MNIEEENIQKCEVDKRISKYKTSVGALYPLLKEKCILRKCKLEIYRINLKPYYHKEQMHGCYIRKQNANFRGQR